MKNIRQELGFTQEELAIILGVSRSLISLYDKGMRSLPKKALEKLSKIQLWVAETELEKPQLCRKMLALQQKHRQEAQKFLHAHAKNAAARAVRLTMELAVLRTRFQHLEKKLCLIQLLLRQAPAGSRESKLLRNLEDQTLHSFDTSNPTSEYACAFHLALLISSQQVAFDMEKRLQRKSKGF